MEISLIFQSHGKEVLWMNGYFEYLVEKGSEVIFFFLINNPHVGLCEM